MAHPPGSPPRAPTDEKRAILAMLQRFGGAKHAPAASHGTPEGASNHRTTLARRKA
jgi:hypothetical protein